MTALTLGTVPPNPSKLLGSLYEEDLIIAQATSLNRRTAEFSKPSLELLLLLWRLHESIVDLVRGKAHGVQHTFRHVRPLLWPRRVSASLATDSELDPSGASQGSAA
jgi:hypothetical protein